MGTPGGAVLALDAVLAAGHDVPLVVTRPDRPAGRSKTPQPPAVKAFATPRGLSVIQPDNVRSDEFVEAIAGAAPDALAVVAFGRILPRRVLDAARHGAINLHFSLLPAYRGAAPVQWALASGESVTGVTTFRIDEGRARARAPRPARGHGGGPPRRDARGACRGFGPADAAGSRSGDGRADAHASRRAVGSLLEGPRARRARSRVRSLARRLGEAPRKTDPHRRCARAPRRDREGPPWHRPRALRRRRPVVLRRRHGRGFGLGPARWGPRDDCARGGQRAPAVSGRSD